LTGESGRFSSAPTFVVGIFCGDIKLGEGWGISQKMATHRVRHLLLRSFSRPLLLTFILDAHSSFALPSTSPNLT
jgi:hypothetical protein